MRDFKWSSAFNNGLENMFMPRGAEGQRMGGMFAQHHNPGDDVGPMPEDGGYGFTPGQFIQNKFMDSNLGKGYQFLKGFMR